MGVNKLAALAAGNCMRIYGSLICRPLSIAAQLKMLIDILAHASEFSDIPIRYREEKMLQHLSARLPIKLPEAKYNDPHVKANLLLQVRISHSPRGVDGHF